MEDSQRTSGLSWLAAGTAAATLVLICFGGLVTSHGVGMAVPDWPNTYGYNMFFFPVSQWVGGIFYEHTHRLVASAVGFLTVILALALSGRPARRWLRGVGAGLVAVGLLTWWGAPGHRQDAIVALLTGAAGVVAGFYWPRSAPASTLLRRLGWLAVGAVVLQGVLGGLRVVLYRDEIGIIHALLAQLFLLLLGVIALESHPRWQAWRACAEDALRARTLRGPGLLAVGLIVIQLMLGATMRHQHAGLAVPDFPLAYGRVWPALDAGSVAEYNQARVESKGENPITAGGVVVHMAHRGLGLLVVVLVVAWAWSARRFGSKGLRRAAGLWAGLAAVQVALGAATVWTAKSADVATAHVAVGSLLLLVGGLLGAALARAARSRVERPERQSGGDIPAEAVSVVIP